MDRESWDRAAEAIGGAFFHSYDAIAHESASPNASPLFLEAYDGPTLVGLVGAVVQTSPHGPLTYFLRTATLPTLPATTDAGVDARRAVLLAFEETLRKLGVFRIRVGGFASLDSSAVLAPLGYDLARRYEFHLALADDPSVNWSQITDKRRNKIRKAMKAGLTVETTTSSDAVRALLRLNHDALGRKGIICSASNDASVATVCRHLLGTGRAELLLCRSDGTCVGALLYGTFAGGAWTLMSGSSPEGNRLAARALLHWRMIENLTSRGIRYANLGGVTVPSGMDPAADGLFNFKKDTGAIAVEQPAGTKTFRGIGQIIDRVRERVRRTSPRRQGGAV